ncbi:MAG: glycosyltransferase family 4 protein [Candidatus Nanoarchaeia archaeon]|nr:glycosyltransferase family 4 protein [Candidatus Nanoarchaeia archaeon]
MNRKILYIHQEKKPKYGAHYINELIISKLRKKGCSVETIYPAESISLFSKSLSGIGNMLFFYSLISHKNHADNYDLVQGTTYTVLPFLGSNTPVISHFGSTTYGFLKSVPSLLNLESEEKTLLGIYANLKEHLGITRRSSSIKSLKDISRIEIEVARKSTAVIASSEKVKHELVKNKVKADKIHVIHNAIEDYWFRSKPIKKAKQTAALVYLGRMGDDTFTIKLKGINRLLYILKKFPNIDKHIIGMCSKVDRYYLLFSGIPRVAASLSIEKKKIPSLLRSHYADIYVNTGRYEGFCLSLIEAMSQGLVPVTFPIGVAPEIIENGKNGYIVHSLDEMAKIIYRLSKSPEKRKNMAESAMKKARMFNADKMAAQLKNIYNEVCAKTSTAS